MEETQEGPIPFETTPLPEGVQEYLFSYSLLEKPTEDGIVGAFKFLGFFKNEEELEDRYKNAYPTTKQTQLARGYVGEWEIMRHPETNLQGKLSLVSGVEPDEESELMDKGPSRVTIDDPAKKEELMDRFSIDAYKAKLKIAAVQKKKIELRQKAMKEMEEQIHDDNTLSYYSRLQYQRLAQKDHIDELQEKIDEAVKAHAASVKELRELTRRFPHYKNQWQGEIRRLQKIITGKDPKFEIKEDDDEKEWDVQQSKVEIAQDEFYEGVLLEDKGKDEDDKVFYEKSVEAEEKKRLHRELTEKAKELEEAHRKLQEQTEQIASTFNHDAKNKKDKKKKKNKKKKALKPPSVKK